MKIISWNVNGLRACLKKGFVEFAEECGADVILLQETQINAPLAEIGALKYSAEWNCAERKGFWGTLALYKKKPKKVTCGFGNAKFDVEGRVITLEYPNCYIVNAYVPNSTATLARRYFRMEWDKAFRGYVCGLAEKLPVIIGGDFNVARSYIDIFPENLRNEKNPTGFTDEERGGVEKLIESGFVDTFRQLYPDKEGAYTWWSTRMNKRELGQGWRIDYFFVTDDICRQIKDVIIRDGVQGSDHCPLELVIDI